MNRESKATTFFSEFPPVPTEAWEAEIRADLRGTSYEEALVWEPWNGFTVAPYYRAEDLEGVRLRPSRQTSEGAPWQIRQDVLHEDLEEANRLAREALAGGAEALGFALDLDGATGRGVPVKTADDLHRLLDGIDLAAVPLHVETGRPSGAVVKMWADVAGRRGVSPAALRGSITSGGLGLPAGQAAGAAVDEAAERVRRAAAEAPGLRVLGVDVRPYGEANPAVQVGKALALLSEALAQLAERGLAAEQVAGRMHVAVSVGASFLLEIAKLRALRALARRVVSAYAGEDKPLADLPITSFTSQHTSNKEDVHLNLVHGTVAAAAAVIGGCDALVVHPFDAALGPPTDAAYRLARGTGLVLRHEAHLGAVADPAAGAYHVEALADKLARAGWEAFREEERKRG